MKEIYKIWCERAVGDPELTKELKAIEGDDEAIKDRFYQDLQFGTGGLRGVIGAGTNRMNIYTVGRATQGLANYLKSHAENPSVAIAHDSRINSDVFARYSAAVLAANGIKAYLYPELMPTPALSYAVRSLHCDAGICVTASHNPSKYNGYKVYGSDGCQITLEMAETVYREIEKTDIFDGVNTMDFETALGEKTVEWIGEEIVESFLGEVLAQAVRPLEAPLKMVYTPLNGAGRRCVTTALGRLGVKDLWVVKEQENPDGNFPTCPYPNPEKREAFAAGLKLCEEAEPDIMLATDPDCDRVGVAVRHNGEYTLLTGNEMGVLLLHYLLMSRKEKGTLPKNPVAIKTIVTTDMAKAIAEDYGAELIEVLTGFKFIGEQIGFLEEKGEEDRYVFGFEESYGYLSGSYVRDKDAVNASVLIAEMTAYYKKEGMTLIDALNKLYKTYGYFCHTLLDFAFEGADGMEKMKKLTKGLRETEKKEIGGIAVVVTEDYLTSERKAKGAIEKLTLPKSDVVAYALQNGSKVIIRPSGTEPKLKLYFSARGTDKADAEAKVHALEEACKKELGLG